jgi:hypothetical protein
LKNSVRDFRSTAGTLLIITVPFSKVTNRAITSFYRHSPDHPPLAVYLKKSSGSWVYLQKPPRIPAPIPLFAESYVYLNEIESGL